MSSFVERDSACRAFLVLSIPWKNSRRCITIIEILICGVQRAPANCQSPKGRRRRRRGMCSRALCCASLRPGAALRRHCSLPSWRRRPCAPRAQGSHTLNIVLSPASASRQGMPMCKGPWKQAAPAHTHSTHTRTPTQLCARKQRGRERGPSGRPAPLSLAPLSGAPDTEGSRCVPVRIDHAS